MLVADQLVMAELSVSAAIVRIAPVNGPVQDFGKLGCHHCLAMKQAASGLSEERALAALLCCLSDTVAQAPCFSQLTFQTVPLLQTETGQCPA